MSRLVKDQYIPLKSSPLGDNHRSVLMLTGSRGIVSAAAFGAAGKKGRLRPLIQPYSLCEGDLYQDPVKKLWRLKDGHCLFMPSSYHESLRKYYAAAFWTELILKTHGGAGTPEFFQLSREFFQRTEEEAPSRIPALLSRAVWAFLEIEGIRPDLNRCARCGRQAPPGKAVCYDGEGHVVCARCRIGGLPVLSAPGRHHLEPVEASFPLSPPEEEGLFAYLLQILRSLTGFRFEKSSLDRILGRD